MASAVDPAMVRFTSAYRRSAGFAPYESKLSEAERDVMAAEAAHAGSGGGASAHGEGGGGGGGGRSPPRSPPRQNSLALPPPMAATTTSFAEIKAYRERNVVPKYGPTERFSAPSECARARVGLQRLLPARRPRRCYASAAKPSNPASSFLPLFPNRSD